MTYRILPPAGDEIDQALANSTNPIAFEMRIGHAISTILNNPHVAAKVLRTKARQFIMRRYPYSIIYLATVAEIVIVAFAHNSRQQGYWKHRLRRP